MERGESALCTKAASAVSAWDVCSQHVMSQASASMRQPAATSVRLHGKRRLVRHASHPHRIAERSRGLREAATHSTALALEGTHHKRGRQQADMDSAAGSCSLCCSLLCLRTGSTHVKGDFQARSMDTSAVLMAGKVCSRLGLPLFSTRHTCREGGGRGERRESGRGEQVRTRR